MAKNKTMKDFQRDPCFHHFQKEYMDSKPARDAAAKAKMEAEASVANECPVHLDNEWNIRYTIPHQLQFASAQNVDLFVS
jgi:hypothetical protein